MKLSFGNGGNATIKKKLPTMINGNAEITPSRIAFKCLCSESLYIGPDKFLSRNVTNLFITVPPNELNHLQSLIKSVHQEAYMLAAE